MDEVHWIEAEELSTDKKENDNEPDVGDLFADPDPFDRFDFQFGETIQIHLQGHKMENGQTLHSTGLTLWRASPLLCEYMTLHQDFIRGRTVLEVCYVHHRRKKCDIVCYSFFINIYTVYRMCTYNTTGHSWEQVWDYVVFLLIIWEPIGSS